MAEAAAGPAVDLKIVGATIITIDAERRVIENGAILVDKGRIVAVGADDGRPARERLDGTDMVVLPGLIDGHAHAGHGLVKSLGAGRSGTWFEACERIYTRATSAAFWRAEARLSALERLKAGVTCGLSLMGGGPDIMATDDVENGNAWADAVAEVGIRGVLAVGPGRPPFPREYLRWDSGTGVARTVGLDDQLAVSRDLVETWHGAQDGRLQVALATPVFGRTDKGDGAPAAEIERLVATVLELRAAHGLRLTQDGHHSGTLAAAREFGLLGPWSLMSHSVDLTEADIAAVIETGAAIVHNPSAVMSIRGRCPVTELIEAGVCVLIGSDGAAPDRGYDMFRHMAQAMHYHRRHFRDPLVLPPGKALEMVTIDAARGLGLADEIGSIEVGKRADLVLVDMAKPHLYPPNMPVTRIAHFANAADVDTVVVDGEILMRGRRVANVDEREVLGEAAAECNSMLERSGLHHLTAEPDDYWRGTRMAD